MSIKLLKEEVYDSLKANHNQTYQLIKETHSPQLTLARFSELNNFFEDSVLELNGFEFKTDSIKPSDDDFDNAKALYETLSITPQQATDIRLWMGITFNEGFHYLIHRWGLKDSKAVRYHWLFYTSSKRSLFYQGISRLWWYAHITYNPDLEDPYCYTKMIFSNNIRYLSYFIYRNLANSKKVRMVYLRYVYDLYSQGISINYDQVQYLLKNLGVLAGNQVIDSLSDDEIYAFLEGLKVVE